jgi:hypothetical protein
MLRNLFWLSDDQWLMIKLYLPRDVRGKERADDRRVISGKLDAALKYDWRVCTVESRAIRIREIESCVSDTKRSSDVYLYVLVHKRNLFSA